MSNKFILKFSDFVLNEVKIQNAEEAIRLIQSETDKNKKEELVKDIVSTYFSDDVINGNKTLNLSDKNQDVSVLQAILISYDYLKNHLPDGVLDSQTLDAVKLMIKDFNLTIEVTSSVPNSFIRFLLEFEEKEEPQSKEKPKDKEQKNIVPTTMPSSITFPTPSVKRGEGVKRGVDFPSQETEKYAAVSVQFSRTKDGDKNVSPNFKVSDFACRDNSEPVLINPFLVELLEKIRTHFGKPVKINSGYRTPAYNAGLRKKGRKGVAQNSQHMYGNAADITISGVSPKEVFDFVNSFHQGGIGLYMKNNFTHVDVRNTIGMEKSTW
jgi:uncharacterized protein YcbK (DUF882 family)